ncbi:MAG: hypothetical protein P1U68_07895 [Verrucomicrobiales bacterium]|nr:hypothetical protein [Verrucomicrobiales bacterium]
MRLSSLFFLGFACLSFFDCSAVYSRDEASGEEKEWLEYYYQNPTPERFVQQMKDWAAEGTLESDRAKPALIAFLSRVLRDNRDQIEGWVEALSGLTPEQKQVLFTAMLYSRVSEADKIMLKMFGNQYREQKVQTEKILEMPLDKESTIDMLWGFFYATGSEHALRRVVLCFRFEDAPEQLEGGNVPEGYVPFYKILPRFAFESLLANAERHPKVLATLKKFLEEDESLVEAEKNGVYDVLSEIDPQAYPPLDREGETA